jgi:catechol 2,3-dioxygenase-like lactoylglutathione lyase family enzyme
MLLDGVNHIAWISKDAGRLGCFYERVFDAVIGTTRSHGPGETMTVIDIGPATQLNIFVIDGNTEADRQTPMFGRGRIDHLALQAGSLVAFETIRDRLVARGASDGFVTDFGAVLSLFFRDPDGLECEVCVPNPDAQPGVSHPPGTPAARYHEG